MLCWIAAVQPCETKTLMTLELCNETIVIMCSYCMLLFTNYVPDPVMRYNFGWGYIGMLAIGLLGNLLFVLYSSCSTVKAVFIAIKKWNKNLRKNQEQKKFEKQQEENQPESTFMKLIKGTLTTEALIAENELQAWLKKQADYKQTLENERKMLHEFDPKLADLEKGDVETDAACTMSVFPRFGNNKVGIFNIKDDPLQAILDLQEKQREELVEEEPPEYEWNGSDEEAKSEEDYP
jgi:hypothetical protein